MSKSPGVLDVIHPVRALGGAALLMFAGLAAPIQAHAQIRTDESRAQQAMAGQGSVRRINMGVGKSMIIDLPRDAAEIFVADPKVANAVVRSARRLYLIAMQSGQTSLYALDKEGRQILTIELSIGRDIGELGSILKAALPHSEIVSRTVNDSIILTGAVDSAGDVQIAMDIAKGFADSLGKGGGDQKGGAVVNAMTIRGRDQVMLKVTIAEVQRSVLKQLVVSGALAKGSWGQISLPNNFPLNGVLAQAGTFGSTAAATPVPGVTIGNPLVNGLSAQIQAYETNGVARVLAEPSVTAISGESAKFTVGGEIPVPAGTTCANGLCTTGVNFKTVGVTLNFTPVVLAEGRILLRLATEVAEIDPTVNVNIGGSAVQGFRTRKNETSVELPSGGSIVSAGLIESVSQSAINGLPGLMNLPVLGALFRSRDYQRKETELLVVVTPYIAKPSKPSDIVRPTDGFADPSDAQATLLGRVNQVYSTTSNPQIIDKFKGRVGFIAD